MMLLFLLGCPATDSSVAETADTAAAADITYLRDVKPIMDRVCARCHQVAGLAPSFADPAYVISIAPTIAAYVAEGRMPPPAPDATCRDYEGAEQLSLTDTEKATIAEWADAGGQLGVEPEVPSVPYIETLAPFDIEIAALTSYTPDFSTKENDYRCFALDLPNAENMWVTAFEPIIGNPAIVHHVVLYTLNDDAVVDTAPEGFACDGFSQPGWNFWFGWAPGGGPTQLPLGSAMRIEANQRVVLNMHYYGDATRTGESDQSGYGFKTQLEQPERAVVVSPLGTEHFRVPADDPEYQAEMDFKWPADYGTFHVQGVFPHMHLLGSAFSMTAGDDCAVDATPWNFHNQVSTFFKEELVIEAGDKVNVTCTWDNSADSRYQYNDPPQDIEFGEETTNEMCYAFTYGWFEF